MIEDLLRTRDIEQFCSLFFSAGGQDSTRVPSLFKEACLHAGSYLYPDIYSPPMYFVPHSYMGLLAGWQTRPYLKEADRWRPVLQGLWYLAHELETRGTNSLKPLQKNVVLPQNVGAAITEDWAGGDFDSCYTLLAAAQDNPESNKLARKTLLSLAMRDHTNIGHKYLYLAKVFQITEDFGWTDPAFFRAPIHFLTVAPRDTDIFHAADTRLALTEKLLDDISTNQKMLEYAKVIELRQAIMRSQEDVLQQLVELLQQGYRLDSILDGLLLVASHQVYYAPFYADEPFWWVYPVHGFNFLGSVRYQLKSTTALHQQLLMLLTSGLYLRDIVQRTGNIVIDDSIEWFDLAHHESGGRTDKASWEQLEKAVESSDWKEATEQVKGLVIGQIDPAQVSENLVLLSCRNEKFLFTHVIKYCHYLVSALPDSSLRASQQHVMAFIRFLTLTLKERKVITMAEKKASGS